MKRLAIVAICFFSSFASATEIEEVVIKARQIKIVFEKLADKHRQDPKTGDWYYCSTQCADLEKKTQWFAVYKGEENK